MISRLFAGRLVTMTRTNGSNLANGTISLCVLLCGIIFSAQIDALLKKLPKQAVDFTDDDYDDYDDTQDGSIVLIITPPVWAFGLAYIIPGFVGIISSFVKWRGMYIAQMVFCIITLLVMGIFFLIGIFILGALVISNPGRCLTEGNTCKCSGESAESTIGYTCEDRTSIHTVGVSVTVITVVAWVFTLISTITAGILSCRQEPVQQTIRIHAVPDSIVHLTSLPGTGSPVGYKTKENVDSAKLDDNIRY